MSLEAHTTVINRLPDDILLLLFETSHWLFLHSHEPNPSRSRDFTHPLTRHYFHFRRSLALVCRRWYCVSSRLPVLWTRLYRGPEHRSPPELTLARSGVQPLQVLATGALLAPQLIKFCEQTPGVPQRVQHLEIQDHLPSRSAELFARLGAVEWPTLKSFFIDELSSAGYTTPMERDRSCWVHLGEVTDFLSRCPALEELRLSGLTYRLPSSPNALPLADGGEEMGEATRLSVWKYPAQPNMPHLQKIQLAHMKGGDIKALLSSLSLPRLSALHLYGAYGIGSPLPASPALPMLRELRFDKCHWEWHGIYSALEQIPNIHGLALSTIAGRGILRRLIRAIEDQAAKGRVFLGRLRTFELSLGAECDRKDVPGFVRAWEEGGRQRLERVVVHSGREEKGMRTMWTKIADHVTILWTFG